MKQVIITVCAIWISTLAMGQRKVDAMSNLASKESDSIFIGKGKSFVVMLPVRNRVGDDWRIVSPPGNLKFIESYLGQAGMLPNQEEPKLFFFKAINRIALDSLQFEYKNPKAGASDKPELRTLYVKMQ